MALLYSLAYGIPEGFRMTISSLEIHANSRTSTWKPVSENIQTLKVLFATICGFPAVARYAFWFRWKEKQIKYESLYIPVILHWPAQNNREILVCIVPSSTWQHTVIQTSWYKVYPLPPHRGILCRPEHTGVYIPRYDFGFWRVLSDHLGERARRYRARYRFRWFQCIV